MTSSHLEPTSDTPTLRVRGPADLVQAVPYLLGFHPRASLVLVGLDGTRLVVTVRIDLADVEQSGVLRDAIEAIGRGGANQLVGAVYAESAEGVVAGELPWRGAANAVESEAGLVGCRILDVLLVAGGRWWSYTCTDPACCPPDGQPLPGEPSVFAAEATYAGMVALPDRDAVAALLEPRPAVERARLEGAIAQAERAAVQAILAGHGDKHERSVKRALFAAARAASRSGSVTLDDPTVARFGAALTGYSVRDSLWMAVDDRRVDGRELWRELAARLPSPYDAAPLFLFAWGAWRDGHGALARIAAERAIESDPAYSAADLLLAALGRGVDPRRLPKLRLPRSA